MLAFIPLGLLLPPALGTLEGNEHSTGLDADGHKLQHANEAWCLLFYAEVFDSQHGNSLCNSRSLSGTTSSTILSMSINMPKKTIPGPGWHAFLMASMATLPDDFLKLQEGCGGSPLHFYSSEIIQVVGDIDTIFLCYVCYGVRDALA